MDPKLWLRQIKEKEFLFAFFDVLFIALSGITVLFFFERQLFISIDWIKLILLSGSITAPLVFFNTLAFSSFDVAEGAKEKDRMFITLTAAAMSTAVILEGPLLLSYWTGKGLIIYTAAVASLEVMVIAASLSEERKRIKNQRQIKK